jgi:cytochrome c oxidase subunit IV
MTSGEHTAHEQHAELGHVMPLPTLIGVFVGLLLLTVVTVAVAYVDLGSLNLLVAMGIASVKASLVVLWFMHLKYDKPFNAVVFITALLFMVLFVTFVLLDSKQYQPDVYPDHAPALER